MGTRSLRGNRTEPIARPIDDFSLGIRGGHSDLGAPVRHLRRGNNVTFEPMRALGCRRGYRDISSAVLPAPAHSLMWYQSEGGSKLFVGSGAAIYLAVDGGGYTLQTLPVTPVSGAKWHYANINGALVVCQEGGANPPIAYNGTEWLTTLLPAPGAPTLSSISAGGAVDLGIHLYRLRWTFKNGQSVVSPTLSVNVTTGGTQTVNLTIPAGSSRSDYLSWTLERTKLNDTTLWWFVAGGTLTTFADVLSDAAFGSLVGAEPGVHGGPPTLDGKYFNGLIAHRNRLLGWVGNNLYISQEVGDVVGGGPFNFYPTQYYPIGTDGDAIQTAVRQGDRLAIVKGGSLHVLEGFDPQSFLVRDLSRSYGTPSTRGAAVYDRTVFFYGGQGAVYALVGDTPRRIGQLEVGHYLAEMDYSRDADVVMHNHRGDYLLMAYGIAPDLFNDHILAYRIPYQNWAHWTGIRVADLLSPPRVGPYSNATLLVADPTTVQPSAASTVYQNPSFVTWEDGRSATFQVYVQKVLSGGAASWTANGVQVGAATTGSGGTMKPQVVTDGGTGCIVVWCETRGVTIDVWAQKFDSAGTKQWAGGTGIQVTNVAGSEAAPMAWPDGSGGVFIAWQDNRSGTHAYIQHLDTSGAALWAANGIKVDTGAGVTTNPFRCMADPSGNLYVLWGEGAVTAMVQKFDAGGAKLWTAAGVNAGGSPLSSAVGGVGALCLDGVGGLFISRSPTTSSIVVTHVTSAGAVTSSGDLGTPTFPSVAALVSDGAGGCFALYGSGSVGTGRFKAHRVGPTANLIWGASVFLSSTVWDLGSPHISGVSDGNGGVIVVWDNWVVSTNGKVYAQRIDSTGALQWGATGTVIADLATSSEQSICCTDAANGALVSWRDKRSGNTDVYYQRVLASGAVSLAANGVVVANPSGSQDVPRIAFTNAPDAGLPNAVTPGGHVWSALTGFLDAVGADGTLGTAIPWYAETPEDDQGEPDVLKDYSRLEVYPRASTPLLTVTVLVEGGRSASFTIQSAGTGSRWGSHAKAPTGDTLIWGQGRWGGGGVRIERSPIPTGTIGTNYRLALAADVTKDYVLGGFTMDYDRLPDRSLA
jgi:hypothetical protein